MHPLRDALPTPSDGVSALAPQAPSRQSTIKNTEVVRRMDLACMPDDEVVAFVAQAQEERARLTEMLGDYVQAGLSELERRIRERRKDNPAARAIPHPAFEIELVEEFTSYRADLEKLREVYDVLPEDERAKVLKRIPERTEIVAAHDAVGNIGSIKALAAKYAGTPIGAILAESITRERTGERLIFRPRKGAA